MRKFSTVSVFISPVYSSRVFQKIMKTFVAQTKKAFGSVNVIERITCIKVVICFVYIYTCMQAALSDQINIHKKQ